MPVYVVTIDGGVFGVFSTPEGAAQFLTDPNLQGDARIERCYLDSANFASVTIVMSIEDDLALDDAIYAA